MEETSDKLTLVARKAVFGLPTACPSSLPVYIYLQLAKIPFNLEYNLIYPDSDQVPYVEYGPYVAYNNEKSGVIYSLKEDGIADLDSDVHGNPEWISTKAMITSWISDALMYEIWLGDGNPAHEIYYSDLPWPMGKLLFLKQVRKVKQLLGIAKENADNREEEIYRKAKIAYDALSTTLGEHDFLFNNRPTSLDAYLLSHVLIAHYALPETSVLRNRLLEHDNLVRYAENIKKDFINSSTSSIPPIQSDSSSSSSTKQGPAYWSSKPKPKQKREKTEEEKKFRKRAQYFLVAQAVAVLVFLSIFSGYDATDMEFDDNDDGLNYD